MSIQWRMRVWDTGDFERWNHGLDSNTASLDRFEVSGSGNCLEATWRAKPSAVTVYARDIVQLLVSTDGGQTERAVFKGVVVVAGSPRAAGLQAYRAVSLKQRLYEVAVPEPVIAGGDVAAMVDNVMSSIWMPAGMLSFHSAFAPTTNFQLGRRYPAFETVGDVLDDLAATVGRFIVPTGQTYTYDGVTYNAGDMVPAVRWGVNADGRFFFRRPQAATISVGEGDAETRVHWQRITAEETYDTTVLIYATEYADYDEAWQYPAHEGVVPHPISTFVWGSSTSLRPTTAGTERVVPLAAPLDYMTDVATIGFQSADITNPGNAIDGDDLTFAEWPTDSGLSRMTFEGETTVGGIFRVVFEKGHQDEPLRVRVSAWESALKHAELTYVYDTAGAGKRTVILPFPLPADVANNNIDAIYAEVENATSQGLKLYSVQVYVPDEALAAKVARGYQIPVADHSSEVEFIGRLGDVSQTMSLTPTGGTAEDVNIERIEYQLTRGRGLITTYHVGQEYDADLLAETVVLKRLARKAAKP